jgi:hypothetical protein
MDSSSWPSRVVVVDVIVVVVVDLDGDGDVEVVDARSPEQREFSSGNTSTTTT